MLRSLAAVLTLALCAAPPAASATPARQDPGGGPPAASEPDTTSASVPPPLEPLRLGLLVQVIGEASGASYVSPDGFYLESARIILRGAYDADLSYELEADVADGLSLKDVQARFRLHPAVTVNAGHFKVPFSRSYLMSSARTPFVYRPRAVGALRAGRRVGMSLDARAAGVALEGGVFGHRDAVGASDAAPGEAPHDLLYAARLSWRGPGAEETVGLGVNAFYDAADDGGARWGVDGRLARGPVALMAEALVADAPAADGIEAGGYVTATYAVAAGHRLRARWDAVRFADADAAPPRHLLGLGYTFLPAGPARIEVDYLVPAGPGRVDESTVIVNVQVAL